MIFIHVFYLCFFNLIYYLTAKSNPLRISNSKFYFNKAAEGGGLYKGSNVFNLTMNNCIFVGNRATSSFYL
jgi:hypothetical protein